MLPFGHSAQRFTRIVGHYERRSLVHSRTKILFPGDCMPANYDFYKAEYIWIDGTDPVHKLRSKGKVVPKGQEPPIWGFDGSSTQQATGDRSDCVLKPVFVCDDPIRGEPHKLVMAEVFLVSGEPHPSNTRAGCREVAEKYAHHDTWFGLEQE